MFPPRGKATIREGRPRESKTQRSPRRQDAARPLGGGFKYTEMGLRFRASKARKPLPSGGYLRNLLRRAGSLGLPLLVSFLVRRREKYTPKPNDQAETIFQPHSKPKRYSRNNIPTTPQTQTFQPQQPSNHPKTQNSSQKSRKNFKNLLQFPTKGVIIPLYSVDERSGRKFTLNFM